MWASLWHVQTRRSGQVVNSVAKWHPAGGESGGCWEGDNECHGRRNPKMGRKPRTRGGGTRCERTLA